MSDDQLKVEFPASEPFTRIGRVTVVGLALRLGFEVGRVEKLRAAVDQAVTALQGSGNIQAIAEWTPTELRITLANPETRLSNKDSLAEELATLVSEASLDDDTVHLTLNT